MFRVLMHVECSPSGKKKKKKNIFLNILELLELLEIKDGPRWAELWWRGAWVKSVYILQPSLRPPWRSPSGRGNMWLHLYWPCFSNALSIQFPLEKVRTCWLSLPKILIGAQWMSPTYNMQSCYFFLISHPSILQFISQTVIRSMVFLAGVVLWRGWILGLWETITEFFYSVLTSSV